MGRLYRPILRSAETCRDGGGACNLGPPSTVALHPANPHAEKRAASIGRRNTNIACDSGFEVVAGEGYRQYSAATEFIC